MFVVCGAISAQPFVVGQVEAPLCHFQLSVDTLSDTELLDSSNSSPGRYIAEVGRRLRRLYPQATGYLIINPYLLLSPPVVQQLLLVAEQQLADDTECWLLTDDQGRQPLAYMFTGRALDRCPPAHLGLLTTADVGLDGDFLRASFGSCRQVAALPFCGDFGVGNGFHPVANHGAYRFALRHATQLLSRAQSAAERDRLLQQTRRVAVLAWHAGDVLFLLQALTQEQTPFSAILVLADYADIVAYLRPDLDCISVDMPAPYRGPYVVTDEIGLQQEHIELALALGTDPNQIFHLLRPAFRNYNQTFHTLVEASSFTVGGIGQPRRPPPALPPSLAIEWQERSVQPQRIILQFDAGWPLKGYPPDSRGELLRLLLHAGYQPILLGAAEPGLPQVPAVSYRGLADFRALLGSAAALIGCDSFPAHFANQVGVPAITLFGSTRPANSRPYESPSARYLHHPLPCVPCAALRGCRQFGGQFCQAHARAAEVFDALQSLLATSTATASAPRPSR